MEEQQVPLEQQCIECGDEALGMCSCCGANLCGMHEEIQAGFCSSFTTEEFSEGEIIRINLPDLNLLPIPQKAKVKLQESLEISGCYHENSDEPDMITIMSSQPDEEPELERDQFKVISR